MLGIPGTTEESDLKKLSIGYSYHIVHIVHISDLLVICEHPIER
jgi:hypothetical protein